MAGFDISGARKAGYSEAEIADYLASSAKFDVAGARQAGYSDGEIVSHLTEKPKEPEAKTDWLRQLALGGRAAAEGVVGTLAAPGDLTNIPKNAYNLLGGGLGLPRIPSDTEWFGKAMDAGGAYKPETPGENLASSAIRGTTGALTGGGVLGGVNSIGNAVRAGVSGATGSTSAEFAKQKGAGVVGQTVAGLAGGLSPLALEEAARLTGRTAANLIRPVTRIGQEQMASNVMAGQATNPQAAAARLDAAEPIVPNSPRTSGEASQDIGLLALEKGVRGRNSAAFGQRVSEQNSARQAELGKLAGTEADITAAKFARDAETGPMREQALKAANDTSTRVQTLTEDIGNRFMSKASALQDKGRFDTHLSQMKAVADKPYLAVSGQARVSGRLSPHSDRAREAVSASEEMAPIIVKRQAELAAAQSELAQLKASGASTLEVSRVTNRIDKMLSTPGMRASQVVQKSMTSIRERLASMADESTGVIDARDLYTVRKELGNYIQQAAKDSASWDKKLTTGLQIELQHSIDDAIERSAPGFKAYIERYKDLSKPIDQMKVIQEIQRRSQLSSADITTGQEFLGAGKFDTALKQAMAKNGAKLTSEQTERLQAIRTDLQYGQAINGPLVKAPGSDTFQNLSIAQVIGGGNTSAHPALRVLMKPLDWVYKIAGSDERVNEILAEAMLDPKLAAAMLRRATPASTQRFSEALRLRTLQGGIAVGAGVNSTLQAPRSDRSSSPPLQ